MRQYRTNIPHSQISEAKYRYESSLHRDLKYSYTGQGGKTEAAVCGFVADGISAAGEYIEIQTGSFGPLRQKAKEIALQGNLRIVYPVIIAKYIEVFDTEGVRLYRRKSPRRGSSWDLFNALVYAPELPLVPRIVVELVLIDAEEERVKDGKGSWRRHGISIKDRRMITMHERICLNKPADYKRFLPFDKDKKFTSSMLKESAGIPIELARKTLYVLTKLGVVERIGKQRNSLIYQSSYSKLRKTRLF